MLKLGGRLWKIQGIIGNETRGSRVDSWSVSKSWQRRRLQRKDRREKIKSRQRPSETQTNQPLRRSGSKAFPRWGFYRLPPNERKRLFRNLEGGRYILLQTCLVCTCSLSGTRADLSRENRRKQSPPGTPRTPNFPQALALLPLPLAVYSWSGW